RARPAPDPGDRTGPDDQGTRPARRAGRSQGALQPLLRTADGHMTEPQEDAKADTDDAAPDVAAEPGDAAAQAPGRTLLEEMGGLSGLVYSSVPVLVFVLINSIFSL